MPDRKTLTMFFVLTTVVMFSCTFTVRAGIVQKGLISYWTLDADTVDKTVKDVFGENDAKIEGGEIVEGVVREALYFNANDMLTIEPHEGLDLVKEFSIDTWVKGDTEPGVDITTQWFAKGNNYQLNWDHAPIDGKDANPSVATQMTGGWLIVANIKDPLEAETWYHIAGTWSGKSLKIYLNGQLSKAKNWSGSCTLNQEPLTIGGPGFKGAVDEVKFYNRALTDEEVMRNFQDKSQLAVTRAGKLPVVWGEIKEGTEIKF